jgi:hypothetical protein
VKKLLKKKGNKEKAWCILEEQYRGFPTGQGDGSESGNPFYA